MTASLSGAATSPCLMDATSVVGMAALIRDDPGWRQTMEAAFRDKPKMTTETTISEALRADQVGLLCRGGRNTQRRNRFNARHLVSWCGDVRPADWSDERLHRVDQRYLEDHEDRPREQIGRERRLLRRIVRRIQSDVHGQAIVKKSGQPDAHGIGQPPDRRLPPLEAVAEVMEHGGDVAVQIAVVLALALGLSTSELLILRRRDVHLGSGRVSVKGQPRRLTKWAVAQLRLSLPNKRGLLFASTRRPGRPMTNLAGRVRRACKRACGPPFTLRDVRRLWQREGRAVDLPRAAVRGSVCGLGAGRAHRVRRAMATAEGRLVREWTVMIHGPADARGIRNYVPRQAPKGVHPHEPEARGGAAKPRRKLPGVARRCRSDAQLPKALREKPGNRSGSKISYLSTTPAPDPPPPSAMLPSPLLGTDAAPATRAPLGPNLRAWAQLSPSAFARRDELVLALAVGVLYREARDLVARSQAAEEAGAGGEDVLLAIGVWARKAEAAMDSLDLTGLQQG